MLAGQQGKLDVYNLLLTTYRWTFQHKTLTVKNTFVFSRADPDLRDYSGKKAGWDLSLIRIKPQLPEKFPTTHLVTSCVTLWEHLVTSCDNILRNILRTSYYALWKHLPILRPLPPAQSWGWGGCSRLKVCLNFKWSKISFQQNTERPI